MKQLWVEEVATFHGDHVKLSPSWAWPKPVQQPHPPIYLGGNGPLAIRQAAEWADVWYPTGPLHDPTLAQSIPILERLVAEAGRDPHSVRVGIAPAEVDAARLEAYVRNGVDECNVAIIGNARDDLLVKLDALAKTRDEVLGG